MRLPYPSYANVMSTVAVFIALGGTSYAVTKLPKDSVGARELRTNAVTGEEIRDGAVGAADLAPGAAAGLRGPRGPEGSSGPAGPKGDAGAPGAAEAWKPLPLSGDWKPYSSYVAGTTAPSYRKDALGYVELRGMVTRDPGAPAEKLAVAHLPAGYLPSARRVFAAQMGEWDQAAGRVDVRADGLVEWVSGPTGERDYVSLEGIRFDLD